MQSKGQGGWIVLIVIVLGVAAYFVFFGGTFQWGGAPPGGTGTGKGLVVSEIKSDSQVKPGNTTMIVAKLTNNGYADATNIEVTLQGLTTEWKIDGQSLTPDSNKREVTLSIIPGHNSTTQAHSGNVSWNLTAPSIITTGLSYLFTVKAKYSYWTVYESVVRITSSTSKDNGRVLDQKSSDAPIEVKINTNSIFKAGTNPVNVQFIFTNSGGGQVALGKLSIARNVGFTCPSYDVTFGTDASGNPLNQVNTTCTISASVSGDFTDVNLIMYASYDYLTKRDGSIKVSQ